MPPSPSLKFSPRRDLRGQNHRRGLSFESGLLFQEKDDDLTLFNEMQTRERDNFLLQSSDELEDTFSAKLKHFSDFKLGISIPARGENSELLNAQGEKNDYDWLLTPPDTPLFASLDDEPPTVTSAHRGRPRSQPISISRSSTMEKSYRSSKGSASPNRLSPSPRSGGTSTLQSRGRPSSTPHSGPTSNQRSSTPTRRQSPSPSQRPATPTRRLSPPSQRPATPTRRHSPSPSKPLTPATRSSTPTPRRMSTGSSTVASSGVRGVSPARKSGGNSASPKLRALQSNITDFSLDAPPNLRTSLADRPASYVRGSSPASRNTRVAAPKYGRQSMSPTASRSPGSSHSHERDRYSPHSKGSVLSSADDDVDSLQSHPHGGSNNSVSKRVGPLPNNRSPVLSKKSSRILTPSSAPKRSFDSLLHQMDPKKSPQNMFRPLLSSVPSTTFYAGKGSATHHSMVSRNSSITTSSNASSDQGTSAAPDTEGSEYHQDDLRSECERVRYPDVREEIFAFDKVDMLHEGTGHERDETSRYLRVGDLNQDTSIQCDIEFSEGLSSHNINVESISTSDVLRAMSDSLQNIEICCKCGCRYCISEREEGDIKICPDCKKQHGLVTVTDTDATVAAENSLEPFVENNSFGKTEPQLPVLESLLPVADVVDPKAVLHEVNVKQETSYYEHSQSYLRVNSLTRSSVEGDEERIHNQEEMDQLSVGQSLSDHDTGGRQLQISSEHPNAKFDPLGVAGISVLLKRSNSCKGAVVQGRTFIATTKPYEDLPYARDSANSLISSIGNSTVSASSSVDFSSSRETDVRVHRQFSSKKSDISSKSPNSSSSEVSSHGHKVFGLTSRKSEEHFEVPVGNIKHDAEEETLLGSQVIALDNKSDISNISFTCEPTLQENIVECSESITSKNLSTLQCPSHRVSNQSDDYSDADPLNHENCVSSVEVSNTTSESSIAADQNMHFEMDVIEVHDPPSLDTISEIEIENRCQVAPGLQIDDESPMSLTNNKFHEPSVPDSSEKYVTASVVEPITLDHSAGISEDSTVMVECGGGSKGKSLTLEEATDAILFCSSIVQNLAYQAASIAIEKEDEAPLKESWPTVTILGKSNSNIRDLRNRITPRRTLKSVKVRQRQVDKEAKLSPSKTENDENVDESTIRNDRLPNNKVDSMKPPKLESKCNCTIM